MAVGVFRARGDSALSFAFLSGYSVAIPGQGGHLVADLITCERCGRTTADPDKWDPEADTGRIFCDSCWPRRDEPVRGLS